MIIIGMRLNIRSDLAIRRQPDHMHGRRLSSLLAESAFQRRFQFPDRRIARSPDRVERNARFGLAAVAFDLKPAEPAIEALPYRRRRLRRSP